MDSFPRTIHHVPYCTFICNSLILWTVMNVEKIYIKVDIRACLMCTCNGMDHDGPTWVWDFVIINKTHTWYVVVMVNHMMQLLYLYFKFECSRSYKEQLDQFHNCVQLKPTSFHWSWRVFFPIPNTTTTTGDPSLMTIFFFFRLDPSEQIINSKRDQYVKNRKKKLNRKSN